MVWLKSCHHCGGDLASDREGEVSCVQCARTATLLMTAKQGAKKP